MRSPLTLKSSHFTLAVPAARHAALERVEQRVCDADPAKVRWRSSGPGQLYFLGGLIPLRVRVRPRGGTDGVEVDVSIHLELRAALLASARPKFLLLVLSLDVLWWLAGLGPEVSLLLSLLWWVPLALVPVLFHGLQEWDRSVKEVTHALEAVWAPTPGADSEV